MKTMISFQCDTLDEARAVIDAVAAIGKAPHACSKQYVEPEEIIDDTKILHFRGGDDEPRKNINPGDPTITKIGSGTKDLILDALRQGQQMPRPKYDEHLKLLWKRGEVRFDGELFYV